MRVVASVKMRARLRVLRRRGGAALLRGVEFLPCAGRARRDARWRSAGSICGTAGLRGVGRRGVTIGARLRARGSARARAAGRARWTRRPSSWRDRAASRSIAEVLRARAAGLLEIGDGLFVLAEVQVGDAAVVVRVVVDEDRAVRAGLVVLLRLPLMAAVIFCTTTLQLPLLRGVRGRRRNRRTTSLRRRVARASVRMATASVLYGGSWLGHFLRRARRS